MLLTLNTKALLETKISPHSGIRYMSKNIDWNLAKEKIERSFVDNNIAGKLENIKTEAELNGIDNLIVDILKRTINNLTHRRNNNDLWYTTETIKIEKQHTFLFMLRQFKQKGTGNIQKMEEWRVQSGSKEKYYKMPMKEIKHHLKEIKRQRKKLKVNT